VRDREGSTTACPGCGRPLIRREVYAITAYRLDARGCCTRCGARLPGRFAATAGDWGGRRLPIRVGEWT
jgi:pyruvate formate lyase activating enzyme